MSPRQLYMTLLMSAQLVEVVSNQRERATNEQKQQRTHEAVVMLANGMGKAQAALSLVERHGISLRQAQRYCKTAALEVMADPMNTCSLDTDIAMDMHRLDLIADKALLQGDQKTAISALKAKAGIANARLKQMENLQAKQRRVSLEDMPF